MPEHAEAIRRITRGKRAWKRPDSRPGFRQIVPAAHGPIPLIERVAPVVEVRPLALYDAILRSAS
ncbi:MAG: hypothetical protein ACRDIZ_12065 [Actinomycetota bacterium]